MEFNDLEMTDVTVQEIRCRRALWIIVFPNTMIENFFLPRANNYTQTFQTNFAVIHSLSNRLKT